MSVRMQMVLVYIVSITVVLSFLVTFIYKGFISKEALPYFLVPFFGTIISGALRKDK